MGCYIYLSWSVPARMLPPRTGSPHATIFPPAKSSTRGMNFPYISELVLNSSAVTAKFCVAPRYNASICQNRSKSTVSWMHFTHVSELTLDCSAVTAHVWMAPRYNASICQSCSKSISCGMNLLNVSELIHHCSVIAAHVLITPGCNASIIQNCSKSSVGCMNLLNVSEQIYNSGAVTACMWTAPCYHASIYQNCSLKEDSVATICWTFLMVPDSCTAITMEFIGIHYPMLQSCHLQHTTMIATMQMHAMLQLPLAAVQRHKCCPHLPSTFQRFVWIQ